MMGNIIQTTLKVIYPARCLICPTFVESDFGLCGTCWRETQFINGTICDSCGTPLMGGNEGDLAYCDDCIISPPPWNKARSALIYSGSARKIILKLKHADRQDIVRPASVWMARIARSIIPPNAIVVPVPLHWSRLIHRRYNQAALLAYGVAHNLGLPCSSDALKRTKRTQPLKGLNREGRYDLLKDAIQPNKSRKKILTGRSILLVDDVITTGATLSSASRACFEAGAREVNILTLARAVKQKIQ